ncbi:hypothetical protein F5Y09DRAFT_343268 [Xylaria sp. FL1042]|nr:hypothetical protein F5Y09DRAFT_343268 [Xylaria sp. FL1042]
MGCSGSKEDYHNAYHYDSHRATNEKPYRSANHHYPERQHHQPQYHYGPRHHYEPQRHYHHQRHGPSREEIEKRQRQAQATAAARSYGWPTTRGITGNTDPLQRRGNRDSIIEPDLAGGLAAMPGSDFRAVYDPHRAHRHRHQNHRPGPPRPPQHPPYYQQRFVSHQQVRNALDVQDVRRTPQIVNHRHAIARKPLIQRARPQVAPPQAARLVRRDSNGISECSDDEGDLKDYVVSPVSPPPGDHNGLGRRNAPF